MVVKDILLVILTYYKNENQNKKVLRDFITKGVHSHGKIASHADVLRVSSRVPAGTRDEPLRSLLGRL